MKCEILRNGKIIAGALPYDANRVREMVTNNGGDYRLVPSRLTGAVRIGSLEIKPVQEVKPTLTRMEQYTAPERSETANAVIYTYGTRPRSADTVREELKKRLAEIHSRYDSGRLTHRNVSIKADLEARINASGTLDEFKAGNLTATNWRGREVIESSMDPMAGEELGGVAKIPVASTVEMQALYDAIFGYLSKGFAAKEAVEEEVDTMLEADLATYSVQQAFDALTSV